MITETARHAAKALFRAENFSQGDTLVVTQKGKTTLTFKGEEIAKLEGTSLKIKNEGNFGAAVLDKVNGVLQYAGHELLYRKSWCWWFESSQTPFGDGKKWRSIKL